MTSASLLLSIGTVAYLESSNIDKVHAADAIEDLTKEIKQSGSQGSSYHTYDDLSDKLKKIIPPSNAAKEFPSPNNGSSAYSGNGIQCTWYTYYRAKKMGRTYGKFEGNGGDWKTGQGDQPTTLGTLNKFEPQEAISIPGTGNMLTTVSPYGHVAYIEYIDKKGNMLLSEGNVQNKATNNYENWRVVTPNEPGLSGCYGVVAANKGDLKDWGKNPDGSRGSGSSTTEQAATPAANTNSENTEDSAKPDDTFTVNGYGTINGKDWQETELASKLPTAEDLNSLTGSQKNALADWIADYNTSVSGTVLSTVRIAIQIAGYILVAFAIFIVLAYAFDRVGVLDVSAVAMLTNNRMETVYSREDEDFLNKNHAKGTPRGVGTKSIAIIVILALIMAILIFSGQLYYIAYTLYTYAYTFVNWVNTIRLK